MAIQLSLFEWTASPAEAIGTRNKVQHFPLRCKSVLNYCNTCYLPNTFTLNPYRGCEFGCRYCYARYTHEYMRLRCDEFDTKVYVKTDAARVLMRTLDCDRMRGARIAIGTATDPYQPAEARFQITRQLLEVLSQVRDLRVSITTKSALVSRDIPLFRRIAERSHLRVNLSLVSLDETLIRELEPKAPSAGARIAALRKLNAAGICTGLFVMPILPGVTDSRWELETLIRAGRQSGVQRLEARPLILCGAARKSFWASLSKFAPQLGSRYQSLFNRSIHASEAYRNRIERLVGALKKKYGFEDHPAEDEDVSALQLTLWSQAG